MKVYKGVLYSLICLFFALGEASAQSKVLNTNNKLEKRIRWYTLEEAIELNKVEKRKIVIDLYTDWCGWCKVMEQNTFNDPKVINYINKRFYPVKFNAERKESVRFNDKMYNYINSGRRGYNALALELSGGRLSFPSVIFLDEDQNIIQAIQGYIEPEKFIKIMHYFGENKYQSIPWSVYTRDR
jgi:thioredoxin-related protein